MSEITLFKNPGAVIPAYLQGELDDVTKALAGNSGGKRISIRGGLFRMIVDGKEVAKNEDRGMDIVIIKAAEKTGRTFYEGVYQEGANTAPDCFSNDGERPDPRSANKQSNACVTCPKNVAGTGNNGKGRACRYNRRLAVVLANDIKNSHIYQLVLPATSIFGQGENGKMPLEQYARFLAGHSIGVTAVVTEARFDTSSTSPKLTFSAVRALTEEEYAIVANKKTHPDALSAVAFTPATTPQTSKPAGSPFTSPAVAPTPAIASGEDEPKVRKEKGPVKPVNSSIEDIIADWGTDD
jgi:hypothetical protein